MALKTLLMFRHGETDWNRERRMQGHTDIPLNATGREQAERLAKELGRSGVDLIVSSDLMRALDTARAVARRTHAGLIVNPALRETILGQAEGLTEKEIIAHFGDESWKRWLSMDPSDADFAFPGGESKRQHRLRLLTALEKIVRHRPEERIAISTHGGSLRRIIHGLHPHLPGPVSIPNCVVFELTFETASSVWTPPRF